MRVYDTMPDGGRKEGNSKRVKYSTDADGKLVEVYEEISEYSEIVAGNVMDWYSDLAEKAKERVRRDLTSPIEYFMYRSEMEVDVLAALTGFSPRTVRRHMKPGVFRALDEASLERYAEVFQVPVDAMRNFRKELS